MTLAEGNSSVRTGKLDRRTHPWLAEPSTLSCALVELAVHAGTQTGYPYLEHLVIDTLPPIPEHGAVEFQTILGAADNSGCRLTFHSRTDDGPWTLHATGRLTAETPPVEPHHGPHTGIALADDVDATGFTVHPALLDAALQPHLTEKSGEFPSTWRGVRLEPTGATNLRAHLSGTAGIVLADDTGALVAAVDSVTTKPVPAPQPSDSLFGLEWTRLPAPGAPVDTTGWAVFGDVPDGLHLTGNPPLPARRPARPPLVLVPWRSPEDADVPAQVRTATHRMLRLLQEWLADEAFAATRFVVLTHGAVAVRPGEDVDDLAGAAVRG
ncbi:hypothetical protein AB0G02_42200, partial [Actinosynnema sp. NPDC023658]